MVLLCWVGLTFPHNQASTVFLPRFDIKLVGCIFFLKNTVYIIGTPTFNVRPSNKAFRSWFIAIVFPVILPLDFPVVDKT